MKRTHSAMLKFKVALAALKGQPIIEICRQYEVAESLVHKWKKQLKEEGSGIFSRQNKSQTNQNEEEISKLYQRIGQLTTELDFLKKVLES